MTTRTTTCDGCGVVIVSDLSHGEFSCGSGRERFPAGIDWCPSCLSALVVWLEARKAAAGLVPPER